MNVAPDISITRTVFYLLMGPCLWMVHFGLLYGLQSAVCAAGKDSLLPTAAMLSAVITMLTVCAAVALSAMLFRPRLFARWMRYDPKDQRLLDFSVTLMRGLAFLSLAGVVWAGSAVLVLSPCAQLR